MPLMGFFRNALKRQYQRTMREAYAFARSAAATHPGDFVVDCGSGSGYERQATFGSRALTDPHFHYAGLEWGREAVDAGCAAGLDIREADLNKPLPFASATQDCVIAFSVVEHLLMPC